MCNQFKYPFYQTRFSLARCRNSYFQAVGFFQFTFSPSEMVAVHSAHGVSQIHGAALSFTFSSTEALRVDTQNRAASRMIVYTNEKRDFPVEKRNISVHPNNISVHPNNISVHPNNISVHPNNISVHPNHISVHPNDKSVHPDEKSVEESAFHRSNRVEASCRNHFEGINFLQAITSISYSTHQYISI